MGSTNFCGRKEAKHPERSGGFFDYAMEIHHRPAQNARRVVEGASVFRQRMLVVRRAILVSIADDTLAVELEDGRTISVPIGWYPRLAHGTPEERNNHQISGAGYGIHWPDLDEDIGVEGLLLGKKSTEGPASFERWLQGRRG